MRHRVESKGVSVFRKVEARARALRMVEVLCRCESRVSSRHIALLCVCVFAFRVLFVLHKKMLRYRSGVQADKFFSSKYKKETSMAEAEFDFVANGHVRFPSGGPVFGDEALIQLTPRGVRHTRVLGEDGEGFYAPFSGSGSQISCCADPSAAGCKELCEKKLACPLREDTILPSIDPAKPEVVKARCANFMCVKLRKPPERVGAVVDLMIHIEGIPLPLKFYNPGLNRGSLVVYRKTHAVFFYAALGSGVDYPSDIDVTAAEKEGFYFGEVVRRLNPRVPLYRDENPLQVLNYQTGELDTVDARTAYNIDDPFTDSGDGKGGIVIESWSGPERIEIGFRVFDVTDGAPCLVIGYANSTGEPGAPLRPGDVDTIKLLTDLEETRYVSPDSVRVLPAIAAVAKAKGSTALAFNPDDAKHVYAYYHDLGDADVEPLLIVHNAGCGTEWQRLMEVEPDREIINIVAEGVDRIVRPSDMQAKLGIAASLFTDEAAKDARFAAIRATFGSEFELAWREDGGEGETYLCIRRDGSGASGMSASAQQQQIDNSVSTDSFLRSLACKSNIDPLLAVLDEKEKKRQEGVCDALNSQHAYSKSPSSNAPSAKDVLRNCAFSGKISSKACVIAAQNSPRQDVESALGKAFLDHCSRYGAVDHRCVSGSTVFQYYNGDVYDQQRYDEEFVGDSFIYLVYVLIAVVYCVAALFVFPKKRIRHGVALAVIAAGCVFARFRFPVQTRDAFASFASKVKTLFK